MHPRRLATTPSGIPSLLKMLSVPRVVAKRCEVVDALDHHRLELALLAGGVDAVEADLVIAFGEGNQCPGEVGDIAFGCELVELRLDSRDAIGLSELGIREGEHARIQEMPERKPISR